MFALPAVTPLVLFAASAPTVGPVSDWPTWRGPDGDNVSKEMGWSSIGAETPLWRAEIGRGYSSPVVADGRVYATGYFENPDTPRAGIDRVSCLDAAEGEVLWSIEYPADAYDNEHEGGALSTATLHEGTLYVATRKGEVRAFSAEDGAVLWEVDVVEEHGVEPGRYGFSSTPFVLDSRLILNSGRTLALEMETGETVWISDDYRANFSTVAPIMLGERQCLVVFGEEGLAIVDALDGSTVHQYEFRLQPRNVEGATPIVLGERVLISSGYEQGIALVDFGGDEPVEVWRNRRMRTKMAGCTIWDEHIYGFDESMLKCMDLDGKEMWRKRGLGHGALSVAGGRLLVTSSDGELVIASATPDGYVEEFRRDVVERGVFWTAPVLVDGRVYYRGSEGDLVCLDHRTDAAPTASVTPRPSASEAGLPTPEELLARHVAASKAGTRPIPGLRMVGRLQNDSLGLGTVDAEFEFGAQNAWRGRFSVPPYEGHMDRYFDGSVAWSASAMRGPSWLEDDELEELKNTQGLRTFLAPLDPERAGSVQREVLRGVDCYRVDVEIAPERIRQVYFSADTGLYFARTSELEDTVLFSDWRDVDGLLLPFERRLFSAKYGEEWRWRFESITIEEIDTSGYVPPEELTNPPEETTEELEEEPEEDSAQ